MSGSNPSSGSPAQFNLKVTPGRPNEFDLWQASVAPMFDILPLTSSQRDTFAMETLGYFLPGMAISRTTSSACTFERSRSLIAKSGIENIFVQVYVGGSYQLDVNGVRSDIATGDIVVFDLTREIRIEASAYSNIALAIQRDLLTSMIVEVDALHGLVVKANTPRNVLLTSHLETLHREAPRFKIAEQSAVSQGTAALIAACIEPSLDSINPATSPASATTLQSIRRAIELRLHDINLTPEGLASEFSLSRASMYRLFEPLGGVRAYIQQRRLMNAYQLIINPSHFDVPISAIAEQLGFTENSAFSRAFRTVYKMTPSDVRSAARSGHLSTLHAPHTGEASFWAMNRWILGLDANSIPEQ